MEKDQIKSLWTLVSDLSIDKKKELLKDQLQVELEDGTTAMFDGENFIEDGGGVIEVSLRKISTCVIADSCQSYNRAQATEDLEAPLVPGPEKDAAGLEQGGLFGF